MRRPLTVLLLVIPLLAAGCTGPTNQTPAPTTSVCLATRVADNSCLARGNATGAAAPHLHDYWGGASHLVFKDMSRTVQPILCPPASGIAIAALWPAEGDTVIQGTANVSVRMSWTDPQATDLPGATELWVKTAADSQARRIGPTTSGTTFKLASTNDQDDLPHQRLSAWQFQLVMLPRADSGCFHYSGTITAHVEIDRGLPILLYPGHPDRWQGTHILPLVNEGRYIQAYAGGTGGTCLSEQCLWSPHIPKNGTVVPYDAALVVVKVTQAAPGALHLKFGYQSAELRDITWMPPSADDGTTRTYNIPVGTAGDGPYAKQSQWAFWVVPEDLAPVYSGSYTITAEARQSAV